MFLASKWNYLPITVVSYFGVNDLFQNNKDLQDEFIDQESSSNDSNAL